MDKTFINNLQPTNGVGHLMPSVNINVSEKEKLIEKMLKDRIQGIRWNDGGNLNTSWDDQLSYLLQTALSNYEYERICKCIDLILLMLFAVFRWKHLRERRIPSEYKEPCSRGPHV